MRWHQFRYSFQLQYYFVVNNNVSNKLSYGMTLISYHKVLLSGIGNSLFCQFNA